MASGNIAPNKDMRTVIEKYLAGLNWHQPQEVQEASRQAIQQHIGCDLSLLMIQNLEKPQWENAAEILAGIDTARLSAFAPSLLEWLQDMNWPGAERVEKILQTLQIDELRPHLESAIAKAKDQKDEEWLDALLILKNQRRP